MAKEHGIAQQELMELYEKSPVVRHSAFQAMMLDAARYRLAQKATRAAQVRTVPQVQKPGTRNEDAVRESEYNNMERQLSGKDLSPRRSRQVGHCKESEIMGDDLLNHWRKHYDAPDADNEAVLAETQNRFVREPWELRKLFVDGLEQNTLDWECGMKERAERLSLFRHFRDIHHGLKRLGR